MENKALLIVDVQNDFCPGGALAIPDGDAVIPVLNSYIDVFMTRGWLIIASRDWHPEKTKHFKESGGTWPAHCIRDTRGAQFHPNLRLPKSAIVFSKGTDLQGDGYSAFEAAEDTGASLMSFLKKQEIAELYVGGLATDYCVKATVLDSLKAGIRTTLLIDAVKGVNVNPGDAENAIIEMRERGVKTATIAHFTG